ncbi:50S ribosomal protein L29 [Alicyclobacillaceae bacterium I2511]|nr:50S ribosomal protein L29 [Alicyclobacillaceae bacterium I2511]
MKANEIRVLSNEQIESRIDQLKDELFNLRFQLAAGQLENPMRIRQVRKDIARAKTILMQRELGIQ